MLTGAENTLKCKHLNEPPTVDPANNLESEVKVSCDNNVLYCHKVDLLHMIAM